MKIDNQNLVKSITAGGIYNDFASSLGRKRIENILINFSFSLVFVILMWISANSFTYLPFTPVPVTMQVLTVLLSALTLGGYWAMIAQAEYIFLGLLGAPVFAGFKNGLIAISGPTGGYIIGFVAAAFVTGFIYKIFSGRLNRNIKLLRNHKITIIFFACLAGTLVIYSLGYFHFLGYMFLVSGYSGSGNLLIQAFKLAVTPFIIFDMIKILIILGIFKITKLYQK